MSLGGNLALSNTGVLSLAGGGGISVNASTGSLTLSSTATSENTASAIVARDANGDFSAGTFTGAILLPPGTASAAPLRLQGGPKLSTPVFGSVEFDGTNIFVTNNSANPARKTLAFTDSAITSAQLVAGSITSDKLAVGAAVGNITAGSLSGAQLANGAVGSTQLAAGAVAANLNAAGQSGVPSGGLVFSASENNAALVAAGYVSLGTKVKIGATTMSDVWKIRTNATPPAARFGHSAIWTGSEMIIWGGYDTSNYFNDGVRYDPATNSWSAVSAIGSPAARTFHHAVWTGSEMIVWGGSGSGGESLTDGGRYNPATNSWSAISSTGGPSARSSASAVWTGSEMIIWGGTPVPYLGSHLNNGMRYNPTSNAWTQVSGASGIDGRYGHRAVWTGSEMIVWGGYDGSSYTMTGARYNPSTNTWPR